MLVPAVAIAPLIIPVAAITAISMATIWGIRQIWNRMQ